MAQKIDSGAGCGSERVLARLLPDDRVLCEWSATSDSPAIAMAVLERKRQR